VAALLAAMPHAAVAQVEPAPTAQPQPPQDNFAVFEYRVLGNTVLSAGDIERKLYPLLGENKTIADVEAARKELETLYRDKGYGAVFVDIPEQDVEGGVVRLKVTEGRLDRVRITGARYFANGRIREDLPGLVSGEVVYLPALQAQLSRINQQARDRQVTPVIRAGREPGTVDLDLRVKDSLPVHFNVDVNDRYSANTTRTRAGFTFSYDNLFQRYQSVSFQYQTTPEDPSEVRVLAGTYMVPIADTGNVLALYAVDTNSDFAAVGEGGDLSILGAGRIYGARYVMRLPLIKSYFHSFTLGADYKDFEDNIRLPDGLTDTTPMEYLAWTLQYGGGAATESSNTNFSIAANFAVRGLVNQQEDFEYKRYKAQANYLHWRGDLQHEQMIWQRASVFFRFAGQFSSEPLIGNEQFAIGGAESVRGYLESQTLGDYGANGTFELRSPSAHRLWESQLQRAFVFLFYDAGVVRLQNILPGQADTRRSQLASAGAGFCLYGFSGLEAALDWAYPFERSTDIDAGDTRLHFQIKYSF
jgi:hemolysin activation/secretion protein